MSYDFRWIDWNIGKVEGHALRIDDVEDVVNRARPPFPKPLGNEKWIVIGATKIGTMIQVIYLVDDDDAIFIIHARPLTQRERRKHRRGKHS